MATPSTIPTELQPPPLQSTALAANDADLERWRRACSELSEERDRLSAELAQARAERDQFRRALIAAYADDIPDFTKEELMATLDAKPTIEDLIEELKRGA